MGKKRVPNKIWREQETWVCFYIVKNSIAATTTLHSLRPCACCLCVCVVCGCVTEGYVELIFACENFIDSKQFACEANWMENLSENSAKYSNLVLCKHIHTPRCIRCILWWISIQLNQMGQFIAFSQVQAKMWSIQNKPVPQVDYYIGCEMRKR